MHCPLNDSENENDDFFTPIVYSKVLFLIFLNLLPFFVFNFFSVKNIKDAIFSLRFFYITESKSEVKIYQIQGQHETSKLK